MYCVTFCTSDCTTHSRETSEDCLETWIEVCFRSTHPPSYRSSIHSNSDAHFGETWDVNRVNTLDKGNIVWIRGLNWNIFLLLAHQINTLNQWNSVCTRWLQRNTNRGPLLEVCSRLAHLCSYRSVYSIWYLTHLRGNRCCHVRKKYAQAPGVLLTSICRIC